MLYICMLCVCPVCLLWFSFMQNSQLINSCLLFCHANDFKYIYMEIVHGIIVEVIPVSVYEMQQTTSVHCDYMYVPFYVCVDVELIVEKPLLNTLTMSKIIILNFHSAMWNRIDKRLPPPKRNKKKKEEEERKNENAEKLCVCCIFRRWTNCKKREREIPSKRVKKVQAKVLLYNKL